MDEDALVVETYNGIQPDDPDQDVGQDTDTLYTEEAEDGGD